MCLAIPGKITKISAALDDVFRMAEVDFEGVKREVNLSMVPEAKVGDYVLVHTGLAISVVDEEEAKVTFDYLKKMGEVEDEFPLTE